MTRWFSQYVAPAVLLLISIAVFAGTCYVVAKDHNRSTYKDTPHNVPVINVVVALVSLWTLLVNGFRVVGLLRFGSLDRVLRLVSLVLVFASGAWLYVQVLLLDHDERSYYKDEKYNFYMLTLAQGIYFGIYALVLLLQLLECMCHCCSENDSYILYEERTLYV